MFDASIKAEKDCLNSHENTVDSGNQLRNDEKLSRNHFLKSSSDPLLALDLETEIETKDVSNLTYMPSDLIYPRKCLNQDKLPDRICKDCGKSLDNISDHSLYLSICIGAKNREYHILLLLWNLVVFLLLLNHLYIFIKSLLAEPASSVHPKVFLNMAYASTFLLCIATIYTFACFLIHLLHFNHQKEKNVNKSISQF
ncbi:hypothetical protein AYI69_g9870 [Smittium culicis]|uniref:Palmitoyltransferase n=1 Tax=Smittium culicis TaxID=133412 RepID=A0A1R1X9M6_9FUNG|nr:hypothetical protein AYI69_g9870 [Smittium culicis]